MATAVAFVPFATFSPDGGEHGNYDAGLLARADNALPLFGGWYAWPTTGSSVNLAGGPILGSYCHPWPVGVGGSSYSPDALTELHGTKLALYAYDPTTDTFTDLSRAGGYSSGIKVPAAWRFASVGNDVWACNGVDIMQRRTNNTGAFANGPVSAFTPVPRFLATVREHLVVANLNQAGRAADEIAWSDADDATNFDAATGTSTSLAGSMPIRSRPGQITGLVGGEYGIIFKRRGMWSLQLTGGKDVFRRNEISGTIGTPYPGSVVAASDGYVYFRALDGFYRQGGLAAPEPLPGLAWITGDLDMSPFSISEAIPSTMWREDLRVVGAESVSTGAIFWFWRKRSGGDADDRKITGACYDTRAQRWGGLLKTAAPELVSTICSRPVNDQAAVSLLWDLVGSRFDGTNAQRSAYDGTNAHAVSFATKKFPLSFDEAGGARPVRVTGVMPIVGTESNTSYLGPGLLPIPAGTQVKLHRANDPNFAQSLDADGNLVSPTVDTTDTTHLDYKGFFPNTAEGTWFTLEINFPANAGFRSAPGAYVRYEVT